jgi:murein L,D-transpeptidase YafK
MRFDCFMRLHFFAASIFATLCLGLVNVAYAKKLPAGSPQISSTNAPQITSPPGSAEARLIEIYQLIAKSQGGLALAKADALTKDFPNFQLAQLVYGDLLASRIRPVKTLGDIPEAQLKGSEATLQQLRDESQVRLKALIERPQTGAIPSEFLTLSSANKHAIAVDASRSRLYLFENRATGLVLINDFYISIGKSGLEKTIEGDFRTPLGIYFITSNLDPKSLKDIYGSGALPINYPNILDSKRGKTGKGIWLHGTPTAQFSRPPKATDGCVVLANPDLIHIIKSVEVRTTPVVISKRLNWVSPGTAQLTKKPFDEALNAWRMAKSKGELDKVLNFYSPDFSANGMNLPQWTPLLRNDLKKAKGRDIALKDLSMLHWTDSGETMVVTFGEVSAGRLTGPMKRQYWTRQSQQWKIFFEGVI